MSKHTPGPWQILRKSWPMRLEGNAHQVTDGNRYPTAFVPAWDKDENGEENKEEAFANARLIAAAPCLLEALGRAVSALEIADKAIGILSNGGTNPYREKSIEIARAAIAKATGEKT